MKRRSAFSDFVYENPSASVFELKLAALDFDLSEADADQAMLDAWNRHRAERVQKPKTARREVFERESKAKESNPCQTKKCRVVNEYDDAIRFGVTLFFAWLAELPLYFLMDNRMPNSLSLSLCPLGFYIAIRLILRNFEIEHGKSPKQVTAHEFIEATVCCFFCAMFTPFLIVASPYYFYKWYKTH